MSEACRSGPKHYGRVSDFRETKMENEATPEVARAIESTVEHKKSAISLNDRKGELYEQVLYARHTFG